MLQLGACFAIMIIASLVGFGAGLAVAVTKALAVLFLVLFFVSLFRLLSEADPPRSAGS